MWNQLSEAEQIEPQQFFWEGHISYLLVGYFSQIKSKRRMWIHVKQVRHVRRSVGGNVRSALQHSCPSLAGSGMDAEHCCVRFLCVSGSTCPLQHCIECWERAERRIPSPRTAAPLWEGSCPTMQLHGHPPWLEFAFQFLLEKIAAELLCYLFTNPGRGQLVLLQVFLSSGHVPQPPRAPVTKWWLYLSSLALSSWKMFLLQARTASCRNRFVSNTSFVQVFCPQIFVMQPFRQSGTGPFIGSAQNTQVIFMI